MIVVDIGLFTTTFCCLAAANVLAEWIICDLCLLARCCSNTRRDTVLALPVAGFVELAGACLDRLSAQPSSHQTAACEVLQRSAATIPPFCSIARRCALVSEVSKDPGRIVGKLARHLVRLGPTMSFIDRLRSRETSASEGGVDVCANRDTHWRRLNAALRWIRHSSGRNSDGWSRARYLLSRLVRHRRAGCPERHWRPERFGCIVRWRGGRCAPPTCVEAEMSTPSPSWEGKKSMGDFPARTPSFLTGMELLPRARARRR